MPDHQGHQFRIPTFQKNQIGPFFDPFLPQKWQKKGQNVGGPKNFSSGWIFCFSLVFNYFNQFLYGIFLKSLKIEIESCTEPKTLGRSKNLKFASCQYFWGNGTQFLCKLSLNKTKLSCDSKKIRSGLFLIHFWPKIGKTSVKMKISLNSLSINKSGVCFLSSMVVSKILLKFFC